MAFFRGSRFRRRPFGRVSRPYRRRLPGARDPRSPGAGRWNIAQFYFENTMSITDNPSGAKTACSNTFFELAKVLDRLGDSANATGEAFANVSKSVDIFAVDIHYGAKWANRIIDVGEGNDFNFTGYFRNMRMHNRFSLCTDRLGAGGTPSSVNANFGISQFPIRTVPGGSADITNEEQNFPLQTHWTHYETMFASLPDKVIQADVNTLYVGQGIDTHTQYSGRVRRKLRARVDDWHGLYFTWSVLTPPNAQFGQYSPDGTLIVGGWALGRLWYRWRF